CDHQFWDVNNQCPVFDLYHVVDPNDPTKRIGLAATNEPGEQVGMDRMTHFEAYISTKRVYLFLNGEPYGCTNLPAVSVPAGPVTVTYGDVLYHSIVDLTFSYTKQYMQTLSRRHYDNLGFKSGVG